MARFGARSKSKLVMIALTCYRAPKWPDPEFFPRKILKKYPPARNSGLPEFLTPKILENTEKNALKIPKKKPRKNTIFGYFFFVFFFGILGVFSWGSRILAWGVFFRYFSWNFRVGPSWGSDAGRGVLKSKLVMMSVQMVCAQEPLKRVADVIARIGAALSRAGASPEDRSQAKILRRDQLQLWLCSQHWSAKLGGQFDINIKMNKYK